MPPQILNRVECFVQQQFGAMFTQDDVQKLKKIKIDYERKQSESIGSSLEERSEDEIYITKYFLNDIFKIIHIDIISTQIVGPSPSRPDSYMIYIIKILTEEFSYEVRRRYSQFLKLYDNIQAFEAARNRCNNQVVFQQIDITRASKIDYTFPVKKLSSSLLNFFNKTNKQKLAEERKSDLCAFLNQIKNNYYKFPNLFLYDYIELLKLIEMKQQHQKYWRRKQGRFIELSNVILKDSNLSNINKDADKKTDITVNVQHLSQLLQHQVNKINLAIIVTNKSSESLKTEQFNILKDPVVTDEIIKNVDCLRDIVMQLKRKINYDHIRCILKGKSMKDDSNCSPTMPKKGLIEYAMKFTSNELVAIHILKTLMNVFMNSQCNYSSQAFMRILAQMDLEVFTLNQEKEQLCLTDKEFRETYFKMVKLYFFSKEEFTNTKKFSSETLNTKMMGVMVASMFENWLQKNQKKKQFKLRDEQKQWTMVIQNQPKSYKQLTTCDLMEINSHFCKGKSPKKQPKYQENEKEKESSKVNLEAHLSRQNQIMYGELRTIKKEEFCEYYINAKLPHLGYKQCVELMKNQQKWNPILIRTQVDVYSQTRKDFIKMPAKQEKMFRFLEREEIQMNLIDDFATNSEDMVNYDAFTPIDSCDEPNQNEKDETNPKMSTQTMTSTTGSYASQTQVEHDEEEEDLTCSRLSQEFMTMKTPPKDGFVNSYSQRVKVSRLAKEGCQIEIIIQFSRMFVMKYFSSEIDGSTRYIWDGFCSAVEKCSQEVMAKSGR